MIGDAHIVSLGEATHGTAEFFRMKHRLVEFLASEMGFTVFAIEANMPEEIPELERTTLRFLVLAGEHQTGLDARRAADYYARAAKERATLALA